VARTPAWESEYREYFATRRRPLMRTAYGVLGSWPAAEDAVQTAFTQLYVHWPRIQPGATPIIARFPERRASVPVALAVTIGWRVAIV